MRALGQLKWQGGGTLMLFTNWCARIWPLSQWLWHRSALRIHCELLLLAHGRMLGWCIPSGIHSIWALWWSWPNGSLPYECFTVVEQLGPCKLPVYTHISWHWICHLAQPKIPTSPNWSLNTVCGFLGYSTERTETINVVVSGKLVALVVEIRKLTMRSETIYYTVAPI